MSAHVQMAKRFIKFALPALILGVFTFINGGCGSVEESTDTWDNAPSVSPAAKSEYQSDSMKTENRRMRNQLDAVAAENRSLTAKLAETESKASEAAAQPKQQEPAPQRQPLAAADQLPPPSDMSSAYDAALASIRKRDFTGAIDQLQAILNGSPKDELAVNCHYWIGEAKYGQKKYTEAIQSFEATLGFMVSHKKDAAQLMIGNSFNAAGDKASAKEAYQKLIANYPSSPLVKKAQDKLARIK